MSIFSTKNGGSKAHDGIFYPLKRRIKECHNVGKRMPKLPFGDDFHRKKMMMISCILRQSSTVNEWLPVTSRRIQMWITSSLCSSDTGTGMAKKPWWTDQHKNIDISTINHHTWWRTTHLVSGL